MEEGRLDAILEPELLAVQTYCLQNDWLINERLSDSDSWNEEFEARPGGRRLLEVLQPGDVVVCSRLERIVSSGDEVSKLIRLFRKHKVALHIVELSSLGDNTSADITSTAIPVDFEKVADLFVALETRKSVERIKSVKQHQRKQGRYLGGSRPFGYTINENGRLVENATEQRVLKQILEMKKQGKSLRAISSAVSTPVMPISFKTVQRLLQRNAEQL